MAAAVFAVALAEWSDGIADVERRGAVITRLPADSSAACYAACGAAPACSAWSLKSGECTLLGGLTTTQHHAPSTVSGVSPRRAAALKDYGAFTPIPLKNVRPEGWLLEQLRLQARSLSGHLYNFWPNVNASGWIGGPGVADDPLSEDLPYWLNGVTPLAALLANAGAPEAGRIQYQVDKVIAGILATAGPDGWLGPQDLRKKRSGEMYWGPSNVLLAIAQYASGGSPSAAAVTAAVAHVQAMMTSMLTVTPLASWSASRWIDLATAAFKLAEYSTPSGAQRLMAFADLCEQQGSDWESYWAGPGPDADGTGQLNHGVNTAQALKSPAVRARLHGDNATFVAAMRAAAAAWDKRMDDLFGQPTGMAAADETLSAPFYNNAFGKGGSAMPSRGTELCAVVEAAWSHTQLWQVFGDASRADRVELITLNALPGTFTKDMWAHQYLQQVTQIKAVSTDPHFWCCDGPDAVNFGLAPNYVCCTANHNQGWPKVAADGIFSIDSATGYVVVGAVFPASFSLPDGRAARISTNFPFGPADTVTISVTLPSALGLMLRVPAWVGPTASASVAGGRPIPLASMAGGYLTVPMAAGTTEVVVEFAPEPALLSSGEGPAEGLHVRRGPLLFAYDLGANITVTRRYAYDSRDVDIFAELPWAVGIDAGKPLQYSAGSLAPGAASPFDPSINPKLPTVTAQLRLLNSGVWTIASGSPGPLPAKPCAAGKCGDAVTAVLVPYGATLLRIAQFPDASSQ